MAARAKKPAFPSEVYVRWQDENSVGDDAYLIADETIDPIEHGERVGIYELREVKTVRVKRTME